MGWLLLSSQVRGASGSIQTNVQYDGAFMNIAKQYQSQQFFAGSSPRDVDASKYPINTLGGVIGGSIVLDKGYCGNAVDWKIKNTGTRHLGFVFGTNITISGTSGAVTYSGGTSSTAEIHFTGPGEVFFRFVNYTNAELGFYFPTGFANAAGTGGLVICRVSDEARIDAGYFYTPEWLARYRDINPVSARTMGWNNVFGQGSNHVKWEHRTLPTDLSWFNEAYPVDLWSSSVTTSDNIAYVCNNPSGSNPLAYEDGEQIQYRVTSTNADGNTTMNRGGLGPIRIADRTGGAIFGGSLPAGTLVTLTYDAILGKFLLFYGGISFNIPVEVMIQMANELDADLWVCIPPLFNNAAVRALADLIFHPTGGLLQWLAGFFEYSNEIWNFGFFPTHLLYARGLALGFPNSNNEPYHNMYGLRVCEISPLVIASCLSSGRPRSSVQRVMASFAIPDFVDQARVYRFNGFDLNSAAYPLYGAYTGGVDHDTYPNRPRDHSDVLSDAPYYAGANMQYLGQNFVAASAGVLLTARNNYAAGGASRTAAISWLDNDIRQGLVGGVGALGGNTLKAYSDPGGLYDLYEAITADWAIDGRTTPVTFQPYEGANQQTAPETWCVHITLGISVDHTVTFSTTSGPGAQAVNWTGNTLQAGDRVSFASTGALPPEIRNDDNPLDGQKHGRDYFVMNPSTNAFDISATYHDPIAITPTTAGTGTITAWASPGLDNLVEDHKLSDVGYSLAFDYLTQSVARTHSKRPCWFLIQGDSAWSAMKGGIFSEKYRIYDAAKDWR
jgi:hypothetical protein